MSVRTVTISVMWLAVAIGREAGDGGVIGGGPPLATSNKSQHRTSSAPILARVTTASPQSYTPRYLAEKILTSRGAMEGERKEVTVLFCDVVGSSSLAERLDPETMHQIMDRALRLMAEAIHRYEGTVNQFLGDGLMALFGAPVALEDHALRAVMAALMMRETISAYNASSTPSAT